MTFVTLLAGALVTPAVLQRSDAAAACTAATPWFCQPESEFAPPLPTAVVGCTDLASSEVAKLIGALPPLEIARPRGDQRADIDEIDIELTLASSTRQQLASSLATLERCGLVQTCMHSCAPPA